MHKIVLDTNIFISALLSPNGICRKIVRLCLEEKVQSLMGDALFNEYEDVLSRPQLFIDCPVLHEEREELLDAFSMSCEWVKIFYKWRPNLLDEGDNHLIELAVAGSPFGKVACHTP